MVLKLGQASESPEGSFQHGSLRPNSGGFRLEFFDSVVWGDAPELTPAALAMLVMPV